VKYSKEDIVQIHAKLQFSTLIVLPEGEGILDFTTGDKEFWSSTVRTTFVTFIRPRPAFAAIGTLSPRGHVYSFVLPEISDQPNADPDLRPFVEPEEGSGIAANTGLRGYVSAAEALAIGTFANSRLLIEVSTRAIGSQFNGRLDISRLPIRVFQCGYAETGMT
jgi:hypothetical protein